MLRLRKRDHDDLSRRKHVLGRCNAHRRNTFVSGESLAQRAPQLAEELVEVCSVRRHAESLWIAEGERSKTVMSEPIRVRSGAVLAEPAHRFTAFRTIAATQKYCVTPFCHDGYMSSIVVPEVADLEGLDPRALGRVLLELDGVRRRVEALIAETVGVAERTVAYAEDGHASVTGWVRATCNLSAVDTKAIVQCSRLLHAVPEVRVAAHAGMLGVAQTRLLARVHANRRCAAQLPGSAGLLVGHAQSLWHDEFVVLLGTWQDLADADGAHNGHERAHDGRDAHVSIVDKRVYVDANGGVVAGSVFTEVFDRFVDAEFRTDWDAGVDQWGARMNPQRLDRTPGQRRFDALLADLHCCCGVGCGRGVRSVGQPGRRSDHLRPSSHHTVGW